MPVHTADIIQLLSTLSSEEKLQLTTKESVKNGLIVGGSTIAGGIVLGPIGLALGAIVSGCVATFFAWNKFSSVVEILVKMDGDKKEELAENVRRIITNVNAADIVGFAAIIASNPQVKQQVLNEIVSYVSREFNMAVHIN